MLRRRLFLECIAPAAAGLVLIHSAFAQETTNQFSFDDFLLAPVRIHLLSASNSPAIQTTLTETDIDRVLGKLNAVWAQAGLHFYLELLVHEEANQQESYAPPASEAQWPGLLGLRPSGSRAPNMFHIYYLKQLPMNGIYFPEAIFVKDTALLREVPGGIDEPLPRVTSHELGHAFGLGHRQDTTNLMASGTTGTWLNQAEIKQARAAARDFAWMQSARDEMKKADTLFRAQKTNEAAVLYSGLATIPLKAREVEFAKGRISTRSK